EYAIANDLYLINVDSLYELEHIDAISRKLKKVANVCVRVEPNGIRYVEVHRPLSPEEEQNVQTMPYVLPAEFTAFRNAQGV
ncbi:hypothetical protein ONO39_28015, partial [Salmonella enterica subsp. enterica serovar Anatum]|nr:hypothetical protein [Salmonella enterica subsp. enterica serovar Anatum]